MKKFILIVLVIMLITSSFTGCAKLEKLKEIYNKYQEYRQLYYKEMDLVQGDAEQFIVAITNDDFETAKQYLHPDLIARGYDLEGYIEFYENKYEMDFSDGVVIEKVQKDGFAVGVYNRDYRNAVEYFFCFVLASGDKKLELYIMTVKTDNGIGIYSLKDFPYKY